MTKNRMVPVLVLLVAANLGCGTIFGPGVDGPDFLDVKVNGHAWQITRLDGPVPGSPGIGLFAEHVPSDSGQTRYLMALYLADFHGTGDYTVRTDDDRMQIFLTGIAQDGSHRDFKTASAYPGKVVITEYRESDQTAAGMFAVRMLPYSGSGTLQPGDLEMTGTFRIRRTP